MNSKTRPTLHVIAGPNGAGKTTLYRTRLQKRLPGVEFVNADELAQQEFGHPAVTKEESARGQELAEQRRRELMATGQSLITESTFSHPSKVDLVRDAKAAGYAVQLYHVNVRSPSLSVLRVASRVDKGGHPVPEEKIRQRYERNQPLIREAAKLADRAYIFDNSGMQTPHKLTAVLERGRAVRIDGTVPPWARELYKAELAAFSPTAQHRAAHSFAEAKEIAGQVLGDGARTFIARQRGRYFGQIIGETDLHQLQQIGHQSAVAHFRSQLDRKMQVGEVVEVYYPRKNKAESRTAEEVRQARSRADTFRKAGEKDGLKAHPELAGAYSFLKAVEARVSDKQPAAAGRIVAKIKEDLAGRLERGEPISAKPVEQDRER